MHVWEFDISKRKHAKMTAGLSAYSPQRKTSPHPRGEHTTSHGDFNFKLERFFEFSKICMKIRNTYKKYSKAAMIMKTNCLSNKNIKKWG